MAFNFSKLIRDFFSDEIEDSERAKEIFNKGKGGVWGHYGLWLLYDLAFESWAVNDLDIRLLNNETFKPKNTEYSSGKQIEFFHDGYHYLVRVTEKERIRRYSILEDDEPLYDHAMISIKVNNVKRVTAKIQQYIAVDHWNILDILYLKVPLDWYHPLQELHRQRVLLHNKRSEELLRKARKDDMWEDGKDDMWDK